MAEITELTADAEEGAVTLVVKNEQGFDDEHPILVGLPGKEKSEIRIPSAVSDEQITIDALDHSHKKGTPIYRLRGHKAKIYSAVNVDNTRPAVADYSELSTVTLEGDQLETEYADANGGSGYWYVYTFYNDIPTSPEESDINADEAVRGGGWGHFVTLEEIRAEAGFEKATYVAEWKVNDNRSAAEDIVKGKLAGNYTLPFTKTPNILRLVTRLLAAGLLLKQEYGVGSTGSTKEGNQKYKLGMDLLKQIVDGTIVLIDESDTGLTSQGEVVGGELDGVGDEPDRLFTVADEH